MEKFEFYDFEDEVKLTPKLIDQICGCLARSMFIETAFRMCGVTSEEAFKWARMGVEYPDSIYGIFQQRVIQADAQAEMSLVQSLYKQALNGDAKTAQWLLSKRWKGRWGDVSNKTVETTPMEKVFLQGETSKSSIDEIEKSLENMSIEQLQALKQLTAPPDETDLK